MKTPNILYVEEVIENHAEIQGDDGFYYPARPLPFYSFGRRFKAAYLVLIGKADALLWRAGQ